MNRVLLSLSILLLSVFAAASFAGEEQEARMDAMIRRADKPDAPDLKSANGWVNVEKPITLADLKGKVVLLDFWTFGCINCMHVIPDLKKLEEKYAKELTVIGVHSAKFTNEKSTENIRNAARRYGLKHPIANDNDFAIWNSYDVHSWPTLVLIGPDGKFIGNVAGEGNYDILDAFIGRTIKVYDETKLIDRAKVVGKAEADETQPLKFPGKIAAQSEKKRLFIADTNNHRILVCDVDGNVSQVIGSGAQGRGDGDFSAATFFRPEGMVARGDTLYIADCENHLLRKADLAAKKVETIAGTGEQINVRGFLTDKPAKTTPLNSPWDLELSADGKTLYIAMAGDHRIWTMDLDKNTVSVLAGTGKEHLLDGSFKTANFAQPSGLSLHENILYVADAEASAIRALDLKRETTDTIIGYDGPRALFTFGDEDGKIGTAKLQHALAALHHEGKLYVADTYNNKIKVVDPIEHTSTTFLGSGKHGKDDGKSPTFNESGGLAIMDGKLYIADTNNHLIRVADFKTKEVKTLDLKFPKK